MVHYFLAATEINKLGAHMTDTMAVPGTKSRVSTEISSPDSFISLLTPCTDKNYGGTKNNNEK